MTLTAAQLINDNKTDSSPAVNERRLTIVQLINDYETDSSPAINDNETDSNPANQRQ